jgi:hypothetical protein
MEETLMGKENYMANAMETVLGLFRARKWGCETDEENHLVRTNIEGDNGSWQIVLSASEEDELCLMLSVFPQKCPANRRGACAELLTRINYAMRVGAFEMEFDTGRINFRTSQPFAPGRLDGEVLDKVISHNLTCLDRHLPAIMAVIYTGTSPKAALAALARAEKAKTGKPRTKSSGKPRRFLNN